MPAITIDNQITNDKTPKSVTIGCNGFGRQRNIRNPKTRIEMPKIISDTPIALYGLFSMIVNY